MKLVAATREPDRFGIKDFARYLTFGASPRASINLILAGRSLAFVRGRNYLLPEDVHFTVQDLVKLFLRPKWTVRKMFLNGVLCCYCGGLFVCRNRFDYFISRCVYECESRHLRFFYFQSFRLAP